MNLGEKFSYQHIMHFSRTYPHLENYCAPYILMKRRGVELKGAALNKSFKCRRLTIIRQN